MNSSHEKLRERFDTQVRDTLRGEVSEPDTSLSTEKRAVKPHCPKMKHPTSLTEVSRPEEVTEAFQIFYERLYNVPE